jgi:nitroreductase
MTSSLRPDRSDLIALVNAALLAPSGDNCQPWQFVWNGSVLEIQFIPERAASLYDVQHSASWIALGAVLTNLRVAARQHGFQPHVTLFPPDGQERRVVARVSLQPSDEHGDPLFPALADRCVNRRAYARAALPAQVREALVAATRDVPGVSLELVEEARAKNILAGCAAQNDCVLFENRLLHGGLYRWLRWTQAAVASSRDGLPVATLELNPMEYLGFRLMAWWPWTRLLAVLGATRALPLRAEALYRRSAALALLSVDGHQPEHFVRGGEALERLWLTATLHRLALQPLTGIIFLWLCDRLERGDGLSPRHRRFVEVTGREMARLLPSFERRTPIALLRLGYAPPPSARSPRRSVESALTIRTA